MRIEWLEDILAIEQTGSFSGAAAKRGLTQSAFSRRVKQIEESIGVELFDRSRKPVALRATTLAQSEHIAELATSLRQLVVDLRRGDRVTNNRIVIASQHSLTTSLAPSIIREMQLLGEETYFRLRSANLDDCFGLLLSRQADVAIFYCLPNEEDKLSGGYLETISISSDRLIPVGAKDLSGRLGADSDMADMPYIAYPKDVFLGKVVNENILPLVSPKVAPVPMAETALTLAALEMAAVGIAVAWVPESLARERISTGRLVDLSMVLPSCDLLVKAARVNESTGTLEMALWSRLVALQANQ